MACYAKDTAVNQYVACTNMILPYVVCGESVLCSWCRGIAGLLSKGQQDTLRSRPLSPLHQEQSNDSPHTTSRQ